MKKTAKAIIIALMLASFGTAEAQFTPINVNQGGTGINSAANYTWLGGLGGLRLTASSSPTVGTLTATSTTATSSFQRMLVGDFASTSRLSVSGFATTTFTAGIDLKTGCFSVTGTCIGGGAGSVTSVTATFPIASSGGNTPSITFSGLGTSSAAVTGNIPYFSGVNTFANVATTSITCSGFISCTGFNALGAASAITTTGTLGVASGGTAAAAFGQGWIFSSGGTVALSASTSPTVAYLTATSTTASSTFSNGITLTGGCLVFNGACLTPSGAVSGGTAAMLTSWVNGTTLAPTSTPTAANYFATSTASSTFVGGIDAARVCLTGTTSCLGAAGGGAGTVNSGLANQEAYYASAGTAVSGTSTIVTTNNMRVGVGATSTPWAKLSVHVGATDTLGPAFAIGSSTSGATTTLFVVQNDGTTGILTGKPSAVLHITGQTADFSTYALKVDDSGGNPELYVRNSGRIGIDTATPSVALDVNGTLNGTAYTLSGNTVFTSSSNFLAMATGYTNGTQSLYMTAGPIDQIKVAALFSEPNAVSEVSAKIWGASGQTADIMRVSPYGAARDYHVVSAAGKNGFSTSTPWATLSVQNYATDSVAPVFAVASSTQSATTTLFVVQNSGNTGVGTSTPWRTFDVNGTVGMKNLTTSSGTQSGVLCISASNEVINDSVACLASSERFKEGIAPIDGGIGELMKFRPVSFRYTKEFNGALQSNPNYSGEQVGFIAEEMQKVDPRLVVVETAGKDVGKPHSVRYENITAVITKAVQDIWNVVTRHEARIGRLEAENRDLKARLDALEAKIKK